MVNGQALCASCNITKGDKHSMAQPTLRKWQQDCLEAYQRADKRNFLAAVTPGGGKTMFARSLARRLLDEGRIRRVIVVVPTDSLRNQWADSVEMDVHLRPLDSEIVDKFTDFDGVVTTYHALAHQTGRVAGLIRNAIGPTDSRGTLVILDEIHHAADNGAFGLGLENAIANARHRLLLTGTPWRTDSREAMPYVTFDADGVLEVDFKYTYGDALADGVVRPVHFHAVEGHAEWVHDDDLKDAEVRIDKSLGRDESHALRTLLDASPTGKWMTDVLARAHRELMALRKLQGPKGMPDAGGLVIAKDKAHAQQIQDRLYEVSGVQAPVVVSPDDHGGSTDKAAAQIAAFRGSSDPWIIAVKMISEGVDISRLAVGVYATGVSTELFFQQVMGRFIRRRGDQDRVTAQIFIPPSDKLWAIAQDVQAMRDQVLDDGEVAEREGDAGAGSGLIRSYVALSSESYGVGATRTESGAVNNSHAPQWQDIFEQAGLDRSDGVRFAAFYKDVVPPPGVNPSTEKPVSKTKRVKGLKKEVHRLARKIAARRSGYTNFNPNKVFSEYVFKPYNCGVDGLDIETLETVRDDMNREVGGVSV